MLEKFLTLPYEKIHLIARQHWFVVVVPVVGTIFIMGAFSLIVSLISLALFRSVSLVFLENLIFFLAALSFITKIIIDWYFHVYVVTTRKIIQIRYKPLFSQDISEVLIDQVRCTEVDVQIDGIIQEFIDMGSIMVTFDRPTHQEEFTFINIQYPKQTGLKLADILDSHEKNTPGSLWYRPKDEAQKWRLTEQIFPKRYIETV